MQWSICYSRESGSNIFNESCQTFGMQRMLDAKVLILNFYSAVNVNHIQDGGGVGGGGKKVPLSDFPL